jgi:Spy/CpxP family protein refolding chaperone
VTPAGAGRVAFGALLTLASVTWAEPAGPAPPAAATPAPGVKAPVAGDQRTPEQLRKEVLERMRALRAFKIVEELKLDENASARLFPILAKFDEREMALASERRDIVRELRAQVDAPRPDDARITKTIERLLANRSRRHQLHDDQIKELRKVLTPVQQAKLALLLPRLERDFAQWVHDSGRGD